MKKKLFLRVFYKFYSYIHSGFKHIIHNTLLIISNFQSCRSLETLLIGLYNLEVVDKSGQQKAISFRLPSLAMLSIYHEVC